MRARLPLAHSCKLMLMVAHSCACTCYTATPEVAAKLKAPPNPTPALQLQGKRAGERTKLCAAPSPLLPCFFTAAALLHLHL